MTYQIEVTTIDGVKTVTTEQYRAVAVVAAHAAAQRYDVSQVVVSIRETGQRILSYYLDPS